MACPYSHGAGYCKGNYQKLFGKNSVDRAQQRNFCLKNDINNSCKCPAFKSLGTLDKMNCF